MFSFLARSLVYLTSVFGRHSHSFSAPSGLTKINWLLVGKQILTQLCHWWALEGQVFSLGSTSALILIELKAISGLFKKHPVGAPLVLSPTVTCPLWSISITWTIWPLSCVNLISRIISIVSPVRVAKLFTQEQLFATSVRKTFLQLQLRFNLMRLYHLRPGVKMEMKSATVITSLVLFLHLDGTFKCLFLFDWNPFSLSHTASIQWDFWL